MDVDKLIPAMNELGISMGFGPLMDVDKLIPAAPSARSRISFGPLMDVYKLTRKQKAPKSGSFFHLVAPCHHSHSIVPGGLSVMS